MCVYTQNVDERKGGGRIGGSMCVCVCVCERETERDRERGRDREMREGEKRARALGYVNNYSKAT